MRRTFPGLPFTTRARCPTDLAFGVTCEKIGVASGGADKAERMYMNDKFHHHVMTYWEDFSEWLPGASVLGSEGESGRENRRAPQYRID